MGSQHVHVHVQCVSEFRCGSTSPSDVEYFRGPIKVAGPETIQTTHDKVASSDIENARVHGSY